LSLTITDYGQQANNELWLLFDNLPTSYRGQLADTGEGTLAVDFKFFKSGFAKSGLEVKADQRLMSVDQSVSHQA